MDLERIRTVGVVGAGQMGSGIAQVMAQAGYQVVLQDIGEAFLESGLNRIRESLDRLMAKGRVKADQAAEILDRIRTTVDMSPLGKADLVIEAATENGKVKEEIFRKLDALAPPGVILATNTSSISITKIASATSRPDKVIGMHFMNPVPVMELVEIIRGLSTSEETFRCVEGLARAVGKTPVEAADYPGFIANRILMPMINEAIYALMEGVGTAEAIDTVMKLGANHPMGPLTLADFIGLDVVLSILEVLYEGFGDPKYRPCPLLRKMVAAGHLGRKSGRGFYEYA